MPPSCCPPSENAALQAALSACNADIAQTAAEKELALQELGAINAVMEALQQQKSTLEVLIAICGATLCPPMAAPGIEDEPGEPYTDRARLLAIEGVLDERRKALEELRFGKGAA